MKRSILVLLIILIVSGGALGHSPEKMELDFDQETHLLDVKVYHPTSNVYSHFIDKLQVYLNGSEIINQRVYTQLKSEFHLFKYKITDAELEDEIKVKAFCSRSGEQTKTLTVEANN
ncbi:MAG: hypothetical protein ACQERJ_00700 [Bacillota bacterium]